MIELFQDSSKTIELKKGQNIYRATEEPKGLYLVEKGLVGLIIIHPKSGKEHLLRIFKQGQFFGHRALFSNDVYHGSTIALESTQVKFVSKSQALEGLDKNPVWMKKVIQVLSKELRQCETQHVQIIENEILVRVAQSLIYLKELYPDHQWTRQEIANFCGSTVSTVIKTMAELESMNLIKQDGRSIEITNKEELLALQEF